MNCADAADTALSLWQLSLLAFLSAFAASLIVSLILRMLGDK